MEVCVLDTRSPMYFFLWWSKASEEAQGLHRQVTDGVMKQALHRPTDWPQASGEAHACSFWERRFKERMGVSCCSWFLCMA